MYIHYIQKSVGSPRSTSDEGSLSIATVSKLISIGVAAITGVSALICG